MMQLVTIASLFVLLCGLFGTIAAVNNVLNAITSYGINTSMKRGNFVKDLANSCIFGVQSVSVVLFTSDIPEGQVVEVNKSCDLFDPSKPVIFLTHGFIADAYAYNFSVLASRLIQKGYTVFSLDWADASCYNDPFLINLLEYPAAVKNTRKVGEYLASFVKFVIDVCNASLRNVTLMGHSLGAHISSVAAKNLQNSKYGLLPLLIGTDPAAPGFLSRRCNDRFCKTDAKRVEALHTSALGIQESGIAHLNMWFNGGVSQPGCDLGGLNLNCSHNSAINYLANLLLNDCTYDGVPMKPKTIPIPNLVPGCSSNRTNCIVVDHRIFDSSYTLTGDYCVSVSSKYPYCTDNCYNYRK